MDTPCNGTNSFSGNETYCDWSWDTILCWPPTKAGYTVEQPCPVMRSMDHTKAVTKYCQINGEWELNNKNETWTNYAMCYTSDTLLVLRQFKNVSTEEILLKVQIAEMTRVLEIFGLTASLFALVLSFVIYSCFRTLRNERTRIHIHLFAAVFGMVSMKLIIYIDQLYIGYDQIAAARTGFDDTPVVCEITYIIIEYCKSTTFMWMFIEALHLHNAVAVTATRMSFKNYYLFFGWGGSAPFLVVWIALMVSEPRGHCWFGYNYNPLYWILEAPRMLIIVINTIYLTNIIKVVFIKLRRNTTNEMEKIRKATKATLALLPLLGITNFLTYAEPNLDCSIWYFGIYCFVAYFLNSFQGMFVGLLYCLMNQEVKETVMNKISMNNYFISGSNSQQPQQGKKKEGIEILSLESAALP